MLACLLHGEKECLHCGECDMCEYEHKLCDNCFSCLDLDQADFKEILIDNISADEEKPVR